MKEVKHQLHAAEDEREAHEIERQLLKPTLDEYRLWPNVVVVHAIPLNSA